MSWPDTHEYADVARGGKPSAAPFETMRKFLQEAADQLATEMEQQQTNYPMAGGEVLALLEGVAAVQGTSVWKVWEAWALRHALPVHALIQSMPHLDAQDTATMRARLRDLLGYMVLGLVLAEREAK